MPHPHWEKERTKNFCIIQYGYFQYSFQTAVMNCDVFIIYEQRFRFHRLRWPRNITEQKKLKKLKNKTNKKKPLLSKIIYKVSKEEAYCVSSPQDENREINAVMLKHFFLPQLPHDVAVLFHNNFKFCLLISWRTEGGEKKLTSHCNCPNLYTFPFLLTAYSERL